MSQSTADFVIGARQMPASKVKVVYLGVPLEEFSRERSAAEIAQARQDLGIGPGDFAIGTVTRLHESKGNSYLVDAAARVVAKSGRRRGSFWSARGRCSPISRRRPRASAWAIASCSPAFGATCRRRCRRST